MHIVPFFLCAKDSGIDMGQMLQVARKKCMVESCFTSKAVILNKEESTLLVLRGLFFRRGLTVPFVEGEGRGTALEHLSFTGRGQVVWALLATERFQLKYYWKGVLKPHTKKSELSDHAFHEIYGLVPTCLFYHELAHARQSTHAQSVRPPMTETVAVLAWLEHINVSVKWEK